jgi:uncharacterized protein
MTLVPRYWPRPGLLNGIPNESRLFVVEPGSQILGFCHWQPEKRHHPTIILIHGLEGCAESPYILGLTRKAWLSGFNVVRLNQRNCGGTEHLTPTLYHGGLSGDLRMVTHELVRDGMNAIWLAGYSMGGNLALRAAGEMGDGQAAFRGVMAVCPDIDPGACVTALERRSNWLYHHCFLASMKALLRRKAVLFPGRFDLSRLAGVRTVRAFDDTYTAPHAGFEGAAEYYERTGARHLLSSIEVPTLIIAACDDPFIPYEIFETPVLKTKSNIRFLAPRHGGHCGFIQRLCPEEDRYWAENRLIEFMLTAQRGGC